jgi:hypothetical protein
MLRAIRRITLVCLTAAVVAVCSTVPAGASKLEDQSKVQAGLVIRSDLPEAWVASTGSDDSEVDLGAQAAKIKACKTLAGLASDAKASKRTARADGQDFVSSTSEVSSTVSVYETVATTEKLFTAFAKSDLPTCLEQLMTRYLQQQFKGKASKQERQVLKTVSVNVDDLVEPTLGDQSRGVRLVVDIGATGDRVVGDLRFVRFGRAVGSYIVFLTGSDGSYEAGRIRSVAARLRSVGA